MFRSVEIQYESNLKKNETKQLLTLNSLTPGRKFTFRCKPVQMTAQIKVQSQALGVNGPWNEDFFFFFFQGRTTKERPIIFSTMLSKVLWRPVLTGVDFYLFFYFF